MTALFALIACLVFNADIGWYIAGAICLFIDYAWSNGNGI